MWKNVFSHTRTSWDKYICPMGYQNSILGLSLFRCAQNILNKVHIVQREDIFFAKTVPFIQNWTWLSVIILWCSIILYIVIFCIYLFLRNCDLLLICDWFCIFLLLCDWFCFFIKNLWLILYFIKNLWLILYLLTILWLIRTSSSTAASCRLLSGSSVSSFSYLQRQK